MGLFRFFKRFGCEHCYKLVKRWYARFLGVALFSYRDVECVHCGKTRTLNASHDVPMVEEESHS